LWLLTILRRPRCHGNWEFKIEHAVKGRQFSQNLCHVWSVWRHFILFHRSLGGFFNENSQFFAICSSGKRLKKCYKKIMEGINFEMSLLMLILTYCTTNIEKSLKQYTKLLWYQGSLFTLWNKLKYEFSPWRTFCNIIKDIDMYTFLSKIAKRDPWKC
jgi:hypothetical protein